MSNLITLTTDFGLIDGFVGVMKGVMLAIHPDARFVDITHDIAPQNIRQGAFLLANSVPYFPPAAIHLCIVDPGVGSTRRALAVQVGETTLIGPDNGVLSFALAALQARRGAAPVAFELNNPRYWLDRVSTTFHGRDIFSPCAAHLARGVPLHELGAPVSEWVTLAPPAPVRREDGALVGRIIYIDRYGNLVSDIDAETLAAFARAPHGGEAGSAAQGTPVHQGAAIVVSIAGRKLHGLVRTYADVAPGELAVLIGSPWKLEIARRNGNAAEALGAAVGDEIVVHKAT
ncbi:MAG: SAM-dependent chlorinase/fluorinase [Anaerolineae bacterium]